METFKMLVIADTHDCIMADEFCFLENAKNKYDVCLLLGDISAEDIGHIKANVKNVPIFGVLGNHDTYGLLEKYEIKNLHLKTEEVSGISIAGFEGSRKYKDSDSPMFGAIKSLKLSRKIPKANILISHDAPCGLYDNFGPHAGLPGINRYMLRNRCVFNIHGHHHVNDERKLRMGGRSIGVYGTRIISVQRSVVKR